jgi:hypothetical protein
MIYIVKAITVVGLAAVGMWGMHNNIECSGWVLLFAVIVAL